ncbi:aspartyl/glutamyl-tRNA amidotransferase subunit C [Candidatus Parcubacteria bacterium]|nr:MAG: aspartyl/glutamyl-tRNA amidotransferase subunit C [Candidatus Parcubacteria bacterium]
MTDVDVAALAKLARLEVSKEELATLEKEIPSILAFVETIQKAAGESEHEGDGLRNVMRADENPHESGVYTETLLSAAPEREGDRIAVKQVISRRKS